MWLGGEGRDGGQHRMWSRQYGVKEAPCSFSTSAKSAGSPSACGDSRPARCRVCQTSRSGFARARGGPRASAAPSEGFHTRNVEATQILGFHKFVRGDLPLGEAERDHPASTIWISPAGKLAEPFLKEVPRYRTSAIGQCI